MENLIKIIELIETKEGKFYWIKALRVPDAVKGFLVVHFKLI